MTLSTRLVTAMVALVVLNAAIIGAFTYRNIETVVIPRSLASIESDAQLLALELEASLRGPYADVVEHVKLGAQFDLLFTDVIMPGGMNGRELAEEVARLRPGTRVLFTSGYTEDAIVHHGRLDPGVALLNKPYRKKDLAEKLRQVIDAAA